MGITVRHDPGLAEMYRVARGAGAGERAEERRRELLRQRQLEMELASRAAAQKAGFQQQEKMAGVETAAREAEREDRQAFEREDWAAQAKRMEAQQDWQAGQARLARDYAAEQQEAANIRAAEQAENNNFAENMKQSGHPNDAQNFLGLLAQRERKRRELAKAPQDEYYDVRKDELTQLEEQITGYKENAKYRVPTPEEQVLKNIVWIPDKNHPGSWILSVIKDGVPVGMGGVRQGGEKEKDAAEAEKKRAEQEQKFHDMAIKQWNMATDNRERKVKRIRDGMLAALQARKPRAQAGEDAGTFQAKMDAWQDKVDAVADKAEAAAGPEPEMPVPPWVQRQRGEMPEPEPFQTSGEPGGAMEMGGGPQGGGMPAPGQAPGPAAPPPGGEGPLPPRPGGEFPQSWSQPQAALEPAEVKAAAFRDWPKDMLKDRPKAEAVYDMATSNPKRAEPDYYLFQDPEFDKLWSALAPAARQRLSEMLRKLGIVDEELAKINSRGNPKEARRHYSQSEEDDPRYREWKRAQAGPRTIGYKRG